MKIKVSEATRPQLDWMVATAEGWEYDNIENATRDDRRKKYSTNWSQGGPIIERETVGVGPRLDDTVWPEAWLASTPKDGALFFGPTPLIAAMRCYVASKLGDEVEVPEKLR